MIKKERLYKFTYIINGLIFLVGAVQMFEENKPLFGIVQVLAGISNLFMLILLGKQKIKDLLTYLIYIFNILVAVSVSVYYFTSGKNYIQYAWILVSIMYVIVLILHTRKKAG